jgi:hypothetical protein
MGAARFAAALALADPEARQLAVARAEHHTEIKELKAGFAIELVATRDKVLAAARAEYGRQIEQLEARFVAENQALRHELATAHATIENLQTSNAAYRQKLQACDLVNKLITAAARGEEITK